MASHNSALKAHRQSLARREQNRQMRTHLRRTLRDIRAGMEGKETGDVEGAMRKSVSLVDKMAGKGLIHRNTAARYKSRLASRLAKRSSAA